MKTGLKSFFAAALILLFLSSQAVGRGGGGGGGHVGGGGGYHGGGLPSGGGYHGGGGGEFHGGGFPGAGGYHGAGEGEFRGEGGFPGHGGEGEFRGLEGLNHSSGEHPPTLNPSRPNIYDRPYPSFNPETGFHTGPAVGPTPHPGPGPHPAPHPDPHPGPHPAPGPHPGPGPNPHPGPHPSPNPYWHHGHWPINWNNGWFDGPAAWGAGFLMGVAAETPWAWGYWPYHNPYCSTPVVLGDTTFDYSQPLPLASTSATAEPSESDWSTVSASEDQPAPADQAMEQLDAARTAFAQGDYTGALTQCDRAIARLPNSAAAHEFRGLVLFALQRYKEAAGPVYAVLSVGPGWDRATLSSFYPRPEVYYGQVRALEQYVASERNVAEARFLLGYHYMIGGHKEAAAGQFKAAAQLNPQDQLSAQLLKALAPASVPRAPAPAEPAAPAQPIDASALTGAWTSTRADGTSITLSLTQDAKYTWKFVQKDKPREFNGTYSVADNVLILREGNSPVMVGQVSLLDGNRFNFKLAGNNRSDPGLTFSK